MKPAEFFIQRPVFTTVLSIVVVLFGVIGFRYLGVREFPNAQRPIISVRSTYPGAGATVIENQITERLEEEVNTVSGIKSLTSVSREGRATLTVEFEIGDDLDRAANDVRDRASAAVNQLPEDADPPTVEKSDADGDPIVFLNIKSDQRSLLELTEIADNLFKPRFETIDGVGRVDIWGDKEYSMRLWLDPDRMLAYGVTPTDVRLALARTNVELPSGRLEGARVDLNVRTLSRLRDDPETFNNLIIRGNGNDVVRLRDIGRAEIGPLNERTILKRDGVPMVGVVLRPQSGANQIEIVDEFYRRLETIKPELPADLQLGIGFDTSEYIRDAVREVEVTVLLALALVCLTIFAFLREWRSALIPLITIPIALTGGFFIMYLGGFSINILTLLAMVLAVGLVVDDAVVVLENIYTKIEAGMPPREAAMAGLREIFAAVVATTLALVAVFAPIVFLGGLTGVLFQEFGITLAGVVVISSVVALTLTPMLGSRMLKKHDTQPWLWRRTEPFFAWLNEVYRDTLQAFLDVRWLAIPIMAGCLGLSYWLWNLMPSELAPTEDRGLLILSVSGPQGSNFNYMEEIMDQLDRLVLENVPEAEAMISVTSPGFGASTTVNSGFARLVLVPSGERDRTQDQIATDLGQRVKAIPGAEISVRQPATISVGRRGLPVQFVVQNQEFRKVVDVLPDFLARAREREEFAFVNVDLEFTSPELEVDIDRNRAESLGIRVADIAETIRAALSGQRFGYFLKNDQQYEIIGQLERAGRNAPLDLNRLSVRNDRGALVSLDNVASFREQSTPPVLYRFNRFPSATFSANLAGDYTLGQGIEAMREVADELLNDSFTTALDGQSREFQETGQSLGFVFGLALALVYLVLAAQFESFRDPFTIMLTVPLALTGGLLALWYTDQTLNIFSQIGLIMLVGLVTKNGILLVEFANQRRREAGSLREAVEQAAAARFRPILMTTISTILGTLPIALALGSGAQSRIPLGVAVIGGLVVGSLLTLFVIPAAYISLASPMKDEQKQPSTGKALMPRRDGALVPGEAD